MTLPAHRGHAKSRASRPPSRRLSRAPVVSRCASGFAFLTAFTLFSCSQASPRIAEQKASLGGETVALVGNAPIHASLVARVASAQRIEPRAALDHLVDDALASEGALAAGLDRSPDIAWSLVSTRARIVADRVRDDVRNAGPPTDAEIAGLTALHWKEVDAPESIRVIHAIVLRKEGATPAQLERAKAIATEIAHAETSATSDDDFDSRAKAVPHEGFEIKVERLPPFVLDGRVSDPESGGAMDATFAKAAFALGPPGTPSGTSGVVETAFGWHVIRAIAHVPPKQTSLESRRTAFADEVIARRGHDAMKSRIDALRASTKIELMTDAESIMSGISRDIFSQAQPGPTSPGAKPTSPATP